MKREGWEAETEGYFSSSWASSQLCSPWFALRLTVPAQHPTAKMLRRVSLPAAPAQEMDPWIDVLLKDSGSHPALQS